MTKPLFETPYVRKIMSEKQSSLIWHCFHVVDNTKLQEARNAADKSFLKIQPFYNALIARFRLVYVPQQHIAVDESLMFWKGHLVMKQYIPSKRSCFGLKSYHLCESGTGYIWNSMVHTRITADLVDSPDGTATSRIVFTLANDLLGHGYAVFLDIWYSSPTLYKHLQNNHTDAWGYCTSESQKYA